LAVVVHSTAAASFVTAEGACVKGSGTLVRTDLQPV
jgi:hypothetical protein